MPQLRALARPTQAREQIRELGILYHPYDLASGQVQSVLRVAARFADVWARLADAADLPMHAREHRAKAQPLTVPSGLFLGHRADLGRDPGLVI